MKHCSPCGLEYDIEEKCTDCGEDLEPGRLNGRQDLARTMVEMTRERCGFCGRGFRVREKFCGRCGKLREEAVKIAYRSYVPEERGPV